MTKANTLGPDSHSHLETGEIYTVSQLNALTRQAIEQYIGQIWISGELSNLAQPSSGHLYFSLKDQRAAVRCALFRNARTRLPFRPENGQQVLARAQTSLYEARGDFQLIINHLEPMGAGALQIAFEQLKKKLAQAGLFDSDKKKPLPTHPQTIGIITSPSGAAVHDVLKVLKRRFAPLPVIIYPSAVQGQLAAEQLVSALALANQRKESDVLLLVRGGGSLEDLWPFNEEIVAEAIAASEIPVVSGIGHEVDFTIADFVADQRAATPSMAAELVSPDGNDYLRQLANQSQRLTHLMVSRLTQNKSELTHLEKRLQHPGHRLREQAQRLDRLEQSLNASQAALFARLQVKLRHLAQRLLQASPEKSFTHSYQRLSTISQRLNTALTHRLENKQQQLEKLAAALHAISPLSTLERGYAIVKNKQNNLIVRDAKQLKLKDRLNITLQNGNLDCTVDKIITS